MPKIRFTKEDILQKTQLPPNWYKVVCKEVNQETAKDGQSTNWVCKFQVLEPASAAGVPVKHWFNEKAMGRIVDYITCFTSQGVDTEKEYELNDTIDRPVLAYIHYDAERKFNSIDDFKKVA
jgi:hypothetical protein